MALEGSPFEAQLSPAADGSPVLVLAGSLDQTTRAALAAELDSILARQPRQLVIDLSRVSYADHDTMRTVILGRDGRPHPRPPVLCAPPPIVLRLLAVTGLDRYCVIEP